MQLTDDDIHALIEEIWQSFLQMDVFPVPPAEPTDESLSALIHIHGAWEGSVIVHASRALASRIAMIMFDLPADELSSSDVNDALGEIVNMLGGSVKSLVEGAASLSLPTVIGGAQYTLSVPGASDLNEVWLSTEGEPLVVRVLERTTADVL